MEQRSKDRGRFQTEFGNEKARKGEGSERTTRQGEVGREKKLSLRVGNGVWAMRIEESPQGNRDMLTEDSGRQRRRKHLCGLPCRWMVGGQPFAKRNRAV